MLKHFTDQLNRTISIYYPPRRIVSLVPSQTELLFDLGLEEQIVGITKFCIHPFGKVKTKTKVGGTKNFRVDIIQDLKPDLIIGNKEENYEEGIRLLEKDFPVWMSDIVTLPDAFQMISSVGELTGTEMSASGLVNKIKDSFATIRKAAPKKVLYLIWKNPWMAAGGDTFIHSMLIEIGFTNALNQSRYPVLTDEQLKQLDPEAIFLSSEPYPFKPTHIAELKELLPNSNIQLVDGEMFSWYGSRLLKAAHYFNTLKL